MATTTIKNIRQLASYLRDIREEFISSRDAAEALRELDGERLEKNFVKNSDLYKKEKQRIEDDFRKDILSARNDAISNANSAIEELKAVEMFGLGRLDSETMTKLSVLRDLPITRTEFLEVTNRYGSSNNYWVRKLLAEIAEENGISTKDVFPAKLETKLQVLSELGNQLYEFLDYYQSKPNIHDEKIMRARQFDLTQKALDRAILIYDNKSEVAAGMSAAKEAATWIHATQDQKMKTIRIQNTMQNLQKSSGRDEFLYLLSKDDGVSDTVLKNAGVFDEVSDWRTEKSKLYEDAQRIYKQIENASDPDFISKTLSDYESSLSGQNPFYKSVMRSAVEINPKVQAVLTSRTAAALKADTGIDGTYVTSEGTQE